MNEFNSQNKMLKWLKKNLFNSPANSILSLVVGLLLSQLLYIVFKWLILDGVWTGGAAACRASEGFCFVFIREKARFILLGFYPEELLWRPIAAIMVLLATLVYSKEPARWTKSLLYIWLLMFFLFFWLMGGGLGLVVVKNDKWGGLPLTLMLATIGIVASYPLGIFLALGRRSKLRVLKFLSICYIELIRGIPLISILFMSSVMFPLFLPEGVNFDKLLRAQVAIIMFVAAYMAEVVRGGLEAIPKGQYEAAHSIGLSYFHTMRYIIIPQAVRIVIPPTVNTAIGMFKDTSLVLIIALFDLLNTTKSSLKDPEWLGFSLEAYAFVGMIYFVFCFSMSAYSKRLEREFNVGVR